MNNKRSCTLDTNAWDDLLQKINRLKEELKIGYQDEAIEAIWIKLVKDLHDVIDGTLMGIAEHNQELENEINCLINEIEDLHMKLTGQVYKKILPDIILKEKKTLLLGVIKPLQKERDQRILFLSNLRRKECSLLNVFGRETIFHEMSHIPSTNELESFELYLNDLEEQLTKRSYEVKIILPKITKLSEEIGIHLELDKGVVSLSDENWQHLQELHAQLLRQKHEQEQLIHELINKLHNMWNRLNINAEERERFLNKQDGCSQYNTVRLLTDEIDKCEQLKKQYLSEYLESARKEVTMLWNKCKLGYEEILQHDVQFKDLTTNKAVVQYELCIDHYRRYYADNKDIFHLLEERNVFYTQYIQLKNVSSDPNRLFDNRGGKLLQQQQKFKHIKGSLNKIDKKLIDLVNNYEEINGQPFRYLGRPLKVVLEELSVNKKKPVKENTPNSFSGNRLLKPFPKHMLTPTDKKIVREDKTTKSAPELYRTRQHAPRIPFSQRNILKNVDSVQYDVQS